MTQTAMEVLTEGAKTYNYEVTASKTIVTRYTVKAKSLETAKQYAHDIARNEFLETQYPRCNPDFAVRNVKVVDEVRERFVVTPNGNYFVLENFDIDATKAECYVCPTLEAMHAVLKIVHGHEQDEVDGNEFYLRKHDEGKYEWQGPTEQTVFEAACIETWLKEFEY